MPRPDWTSVVIGTDFIGWGKSNYHTITATMAIWNRICLPNISSQKIPEHSQVRILKDPIRALYILDTMYWLSFYEYKFHTGIITLCVQFIYTAPYDWSKSWHVISKFELHQSMKQSPIELRPLPGTIVENHEN